MKEETEMKKKAISILLTLALCLSLLPTAALAPESDGLCEHHTEHTAECGYVEGETPCGFVCDLCAGEDTAPADNARLDADTATVLTDWEWIDEWEIIDPETGLAHLPFASADNMAYFGDIVEMLPVSILADGEELTLGDWVCPDYPEAGAYEGEYRFETSLPEGYALSEGGSTLTLTVALGDPEGEPAAMMGITLEKPTEEYWEDNFHFYKLYKKEHLYWFANEVNAGGENSIYLSAVLMNDITVNSNVLDDNGNLNSGSFEVWTPIGTSNNVKWYCGKFDGQGHTISGLYIKDSTQNHIGLFGDVDSCNITRLGVVDSYFGGNTEVGGLCGSVTSNATISYCYTTATVTGNSHVGTFCGYAGNVANIYCCYSAGRVGNDYGAFCGATASMGRCYALSNTNYIGSNDKVNYKTMAAFRSGEVTYGMTKTDATPGWRQTIGTHDFPQCTTEGDIVYLGKENGVVRYHNHTDSSATHCLLCGAMEPTSGVYHIRTKDQLYWFAALVNGTDGLTATPDAKASILENITVESDWVPIGNNTVFTGGMASSGSANRTISGIPEGSSLFGTIGSGATVEKLTIASGSLCTGNLGTIKSCTASGSALVSGNNSGTITGCTASGGALVSGSNNSGGTVTDCSVSGGTLVQTNSGTIQKSYATGGAKLCTANNSGGKIINCYATGSGSVTLCGSNSGTIANCFAAGGSGTKLYDTNSSTITNCYVLAGSTASTVGGTALTTASPFASGEVAYRLNTDDCWGQKVGAGTGINDPLPRLGGITVYYTTNDNRGYHNHNGYCDSCNTKPKYENDKWQISNANELYWFAQYVNRKFPELTDTTQDAILVKDITVNSGVLNDDGTLSDAYASFTAWTPIGTSGINYHGTFDGNHHTISGLYVNDASAGNIGLFDRVVNGSTIENVTIADSYFAGSNSVGGVCGVNSGGTIIGCTNSGTVSGNDWVGGVCGYVSGGTVSNCTNSGTVSGNGQVGGVCGYVNGGGTVSDCTNRGSITGTANNVGGVCGDNSGGTISDCNNSGAVSGSGDSSHVGGVFGSCSGGTVNACYSTGTVSGSSRVGGVFGSCSGGSVSNCYNTGSITSTSYFVGGVGGYNEATVTACYNTGMVSSSNDSQVGGVIGRNFGNVTACYNTGAISGSSSVGGVCGYVSGGTVNACYSTGTVSGNSDVGGVCGQSCPEGNQSCTIRNCYYNNELYSGKEVGFPYNSTIENVSGKTTREFAGGAVAYLLNGSSSTGTLTWKQNIDSGTPDATPKFTGGTVYPTAENSPCQGYTNNANGIKQQHRYEDHICIWCGHQDTIPVTVSGIIAVSKTYDGTITATLDFTNVTLSGVAANHTVSVTATGTFDSKDVGSRTVTITGLTLTGTDADKYRLADSGQQATTAASITKKSVTAVVTVADKTYNGDSIATVSAEVTEGVEDGDSITISGLTGTFGSVNAGTNIPVIVNADNKSITGDGSDNYAVTIPGSTTGNITSKTMGIDWSNTNLTYNGNEQVPTATATGLASGDTCTITVTGGQTNVGTDYTATAESLNNSNYQLPTENTKAFSITPKVLTVTGLTATDRVYDGTKNVALTGGTLEGIVGDDDVSVTMPTSGTIENANADSGKAVTVTTPTLSGAHKDNYTLKDISGITVNISQAEPDVGTVTKTSPDTIYTGTKLGDITLSKSSSVAGELKLTAGQTLTAGTANYNWTFTPKDSTNYKTVTGTISLTVVADTLSSISASGTPSKTEYKYGETFQTNGLTVTATYASSMTKNVTAEVSFGALAVGQTEITLSYQGKTCTVSGLTVDKADARTLDDISVKQKHGVTSEQSKEIGRAGMPSNAGTLTYAKGTEEEITYVSSWSVDSTTGKVTYTLSDDAANGTVSDDAVVATVTLPVVISSTNYADSTVNVVITLTEKDVPTVSANDITVTYTGSAIPDSAITGTAIFGTASVDGTWNFKTTAPKNVADSSDSVTVVFTPTDSANYETVEDTIKVTINKAAPTGTPTYTAISTSGKTLADAALAVGSIDPAGGSITWDLGDSQTVSANTAYKWTYTPTDESNYNKLTGSITLYVVSYPGGGSSSGGGGGSSSSSGTTTKNPDGSTTTTTTDKTTGTVTETTKNTDGSTTTVETKKDGTVTETVKTADGTSGTVVTDSSGNVTEVKASVSTTAAKEASKTGGAVTLPVEVPAAKTTGDAPAVEITLSKSSGSVKVEIPVEKTTPGTVAVIVKADGTEEIVSTSRVTENGVALKLTGSTTVKVFDNAKNFNDVPVTNVFYKEISSLSARNIMIGVSSEKFDLNGNVTLDQIANVAGRITGAVDVADFKSGIAWGKANGLKSGSDSATRGDVLKALYIAAGSPAVTDTSILAQFKDSIPEDLKAIAAWAAQNGILKGTVDGKADLGVNVTRGQACALAGRTLNTIG